MSLFCLRNFHHLRSNLGCTSTIKFLRLRYISPKQFPDRIYNLQNSAPTNSARLEPHSSSATCNNPLQHLRNGLVHVRAQSNESTRLKLRKLCTIGAIVWENTSKQPNICEAASVSCYGWSEGWKDINLCATVLVFDIITTGLSLENDRIIEIAVRNPVGSKQATFETLVNPGKVVTNADIHGIQDDMVNNPNVPTFREVLPLFMRYVRLAHRYDRPVVLVAHGARTFDLPFLIKEIKRCSMVEQSECGQ